MHGHDFVLNTIVYPKQFNDVNYRVVYNSFRKRKAAGSAQAVRNRLHIRAVTVTAFATNEKGQSSHFDL